jgi:hypothetical protein
MAPQFAAAVSTIKLATKMNLITRHLKKNSVSATHAEDEVNRQPHGVKKQMLHIRGRVLRLLRPRDTTRPQEWLNNFYIRRVWPDTASGRLVLHFIPENHHAKRGLRS